LSAADECCSLCAERYSIVYVTFCTGARKSRDVGVSVLFTFLRKCTERPKKVYCCCLLCPLPWGGGIKQHRVPSLCLSVRPSVCPMTQLPRLLARRTLAACILATAGHQRYADASADGRRSTAILPLSNCHRRGHIVSPPPGRYFVHVESDKFERQ